MSTISLFRSSLFSEAYQLMGKSLSIAVLSLRVCKSLVVADGSSFRTEAIVLKSEPGGLDRHLDK